MPKYTSKTILKGSISKYYIYFKIYYIFQNIFRNSENASIFKSHKDKLSYAIHVCKSIDIDEYAHVNLNEEDRTQNMELIDEQDFINIE